MQQAEKMVAVEGLIKASNRIIPKNRMNQAPLTQDDHLFKVGNVELCIRAGTEVCDCLEDVSMFTGGVSRTLVELVRDRSGSLQEIDPEVIWGMSHMLDLVKGINDAALGGLLASEEGLPVRQGAEA